jgi:hypothetical protein
MPLADVHTIKGNPIPERTVRIDAVQPDTWPYQIAYLDEPETCLPSWIRCLRCDVPTVRHQATLDLRILRRCALLQSGAIIRDQRNREIAMTKPKLTPALKCEPPTGACKGEAGILRSVTDAENFLRTFVGLLTAQPRLLGDLIAVVATDKPEIEDPVAFNHLIQAVRIAGDSDRRAAETEFDSSLDVHMTGIDRGQMATERQSDGIFEEVTPEMIQAGVEVLHELEDLVSSARLVSEVFGVMQKLIQPEPPDEVDRPY